MSNSKTFTPTPPPFDLKPEFEELMPDTAQPQPDVITAEQLILMNVTEIPCLVSPILQSVGLACLAGSSDTGKSIFLRQLAMAICAERNFLGFEISPKHRSVLYISTEDYQQATAFFLNRQAARYRPEQLRNLRFIFGTDDILLKLEQEAVRQPLDLVIIDCFADLYGCDLRDTQKIRSFLQPYLDFSEKHKCLVLFLHHTGKRTEYLEPSKNNLLSGQGFEGKMRLVLELRTDTTQPDIKHLCIVKGNYLPSTMKTESIVLSFDASSFTYTDTGKRVVLSDLAKPTDSETQTRLKYEQAKELKEEGKSYETIAERMGYKSKSAISDLLKKGEKNGW